LGVPQGWVLIVVFFEGQFWPLPREFLLSQFLGLQKNKFFFYAYIPFKQRECVSLEDFEKIKKSEALILGCVTLHCQTTEGCFSRRYSSPTAQLRTC
jgi:hypothetical protein